MTALRSQTVNIGKLFGEDFFFSIPHYQRPFSWGSDQLSDLADDLTDADWESDYFLGTLVLHETAPSAYDVVDGQQRLTALSILLAVARDLLESDSDEVQEMLVQPEKKFQKIPARPRISVRDSAPYANIVSAPNGTKDIDEDESLLSAADVRYRLAVRIFHSALHSLEQSDLQRFVAFIVQHVGVIFLAAASFDDAFRLFTVVNDRGKQLRRIDVLKAENLSPHVIKTPQQREEYSRKWEGYEEVLGESNFESLFAGLRLIYVQDKPVGDLLHEFSKRIYPRKDRPSLGVDFIDELSKFVTLWDSIFISRDYMEGEEVDPKFRTLMYSMVREFRASEWKACVVYYAKNFGKVCFFDFVLAIEKVFVDHWVRGVRKDERYASYVAILKSIELASEAGQVLLRLNTPLDAVRNACRGTNFYGSGYAKYLLVRAEIQAAELTSPREFAPRSVEHVLPQTPKIGGKWAKDFPIDKRKSLVHMAGNLVLLSKGKNSAAQNKEFDAKKSTYLGPRVSEYPRSLETLAINDWTPQVIEDRTEKFASEVLKAF